MRRKTLLTIFSLIALLTVVAVPSAAALVGQNTEAETDAESQLKPAVPPTPSSSGGVIELLAQLPSSGRVRLHDVSTVVQWQDELGNWHDVEGWRGQPDTAVNRTAIIGWWVAEKDLGTGPFRWRVYWDVYVDVSGATARVVNSRPFYLPKEGQTVTIDISTSE